MPAPEVKVGLFIEASQVPAYCKAPCKLAGICVSGIVPDPSRVATPFATPALSVAELPSPRFVLAPAVVVAPVPPCAIDHVGHVCPTANVIAPDIVPPLNGKYEVLSIDPSAFKN